MNERRVTGVVVDAGHGGNDPGAVSGNLREKDLTLEASLYMYERLQDLGIPAVLTRDDDENLSREERLRRANEAFNGSSDAILISNHINAGNGEGAEVVYALRNDSTLAREILESIGQEGQIMRKYYQRRLPEDPSKDYYYIIRETNPMQSLLVEYGFIDNANDRVKLQNDLLNYVEGVVRAIANYAGVNYVPPSGSNYYTVQKGDSLWSIANKFGVSVAELKQANNLTSDVLSIGQTLKIPGQTASNTYIVQSGDSLWAIANRFGITVDELKKANNLTSNVLSVGQVLQIPSQSEDTDDNDNENGIFYTVQRGDSLWSIALQYGISVNELREANNLTSDILSIGQVLIIPSANNGNETPGQTTTYTVQAGDSLWSIANQFNITVNDLRQANQLVSDILSIGQVLIIPSGNESEEENIPSQTTYTVQAGDSLWTIARNFNVTVDQLRRANNLSSDVLQIGQVLMIPNTSSEEDFNNTTIYTVQSGDSLWLIASRYNTTVDAIKRLNGLTTNLLQVGQQLVIPIS